MKIYFLNNLHFIWHLKYDKIFDITIKYFTLKFPDCNIFFLTIVKLIKTTLALE